MRPNRSTPPERKSHKLHDESFTVDEDLYMPPLVNPFLTKPGANFLPIFDEDAPLKVHNNSNTGGKQIGNDEIGTPAINAHDAENCPGFDEANGCDISKVTERPDDQPPHRSFNPTFEGPSQRSPYNRSNAPLQHLLPPKELCNKSLERSNSPLSSPQSTPNPAFTGIEISGASETPPPRLRLKRMSSNKKNKSPKSPLSMMGDVMGDMMGDVMGDMMGASATPPSCQSELNLQRSSVEEGRTWSSVSMTSLSPYGEVFMPSFRCRLVRVIAYRGLGLGLTLGLGLGLEYAGSCYAQAQVEAFSQAQIRAKA